MNTGAWFLRDGPFKCQDLPFSSKVNLMKENDADLLAFGTRQPAGEEDSLVE